MIGHEIAEHVARVWCSQCGRPEEQQAVVGVVETERTRVALNYLLDDLRKRAVYLPYKRKTDLQGSIARLVKEIATHDEKHPKN